MNLKFTLHILILVFFISSCASKFSLQKKRYSRGFHLSSSAKSTQVPSISKSGEKKKPIITSQETASVAINETEPIKQTEIDKKADVETLASQTLKAKHENKITSAIHGNALPPFLPAREKNIELKNKNTDLSQNKARIGFFRGLRGIMCLITAFVSLAFAIIFIGLAQTSVGSTASLAFLLALLFLVVGLLNLFFALILLR